jgi:hypothetical protein
MPVITPDTSRAYPDRMNESGGHPAHAAYGHAAGVLASGDVRVRVRPDGESPTGT